MLDNDKIQRLANIATICQYGMKAVNSLPSGTNVKVVTKLVTTLKELEKEFINVILDDDDNDDVNNKDLNEF